MSSLADLIRPRDTESGKQLYALQKRLFLPLWWIDGYLNSFKQPHIPYTNDFLVGPRLDAELFFLVAATWNELIILASKDPDKKVARISLSRMMKNATEKQKESLNQLATYWTSPFSMRQGVVNFVTSSQMWEPIPHELVLELEFTVTLRELCLGPKFSELSKGFVSLSPDILQAFGTGNIQKLVPYLWLERVKQNSDLQLDKLGWFGMKSDDELWESKGFSKYYRKLYDHGFLGWENTAPAVRVSDLQVMGENVFSKTTHRVKCWKYSNQTLEAISWEEAVWKSFQTPAKVTLPTQKKTVTVQRELTYDSEMDFLLKVSEFYESLTPTQQQAFDHQRRSMSSDEFKSYVTPILKNKKAVVKEQRI